MAPDPPAAAAPLQNDRITALAFSPDGALLASGSRDGTVALWDTATGERIAFYTAYSLKLGLTVPDFFGRPAEPFNPLVEVGALAFSPDGRRLARGGANGGVTLIDLRGLEPPSPLPPIDQPVSALAFAPDGASLAVGGTGSLHHVDLRSGRSRPLQGQIATVSALHFAASDRLISAGGEAAVLWNPTATHVGSLLADGERVRSLALSPDGRLLAVGRSDRSVHLHDLESGQEVARLRAGDISWAKLTFSPSGQRIAGGSPGGGEFQVLDVLTGEALTPLVTARQPFSDLVFEGEDIVVINHRYGLDRWSISSQAFTETVPDASLLAGRQYLRVEGGLQDPEGRFVPLGYPAFVDYAPSRDLYATTDGSTVRLWDPDAQQVVATLEGHTDAITALAFSGDGNRLATGGLDNRMLLWELEHQPVVGRAFEGHTSQVDALQFLERQPLIASGGRDGRVILWPASPEAWRQALCRRAGGGASEAELLHYQPEIATRATACASGGSG